eukprot:6211097-Pleurochrysis_carterae.AAC.1
MLADAVGDDTRFDWQARNWRCSLARRRAKFATLSCAKSAASSAEDVVRCDGGVGTAEEVRD